MEAKSELLYMAVAVIIFGLFLNSWYDGEKTQRYMQKQLKEQCNQERVVMEKR